MSSKTEGTGPNAVQVNKIKHYNGLHDLHRFQCENHGIWVRLHGHLQSLTNPGNELNIGGFRGIGTLKQS